MVFVFKNGERLIKCDGIDFEDEEKFREVLLKLIDEDRNLLLPKSLEGSRPSILFLVKEFGVASGSIDLLGIDSEGFIYIIETKLYRSSERRRALAQAIDYASALWSEYSNGVDTFIERLKGGTDLSEELIENVKDNIRNGGLRLVVAMDHVDEITKNAIDFLNEMCEFDVYALVLERYKSSDDMEVIVPRLYPESPPIVSIERVKKKWDWKTFLEDAKNKGLSGTQLEILKRIYDFSVEITKGRGGLRWGTGRKYGTFRVFLEDLFEGKDIYLVSSNGVLQINFMLLYPDSFKTSENTNKKIEIINKFAEQLYNVGILSELVTNENYKETGKRYPNVKSEKWMNRIEDFQKAVIELVNNMEKLES